MTQEDKELLLKDICARLPYNIKIDYSFINDERIRIHTVRTLTYRNFQDICIDEWHTNEEIYKPYLRPMSSMTEEEIKEAENISRLKYIDGTFAELKQFTLINDNFVDWLNAHHFDYRGLIEKGLVLEAPENMYLHLGK